MLQRLSVLVLLLTTGACATSGPLKISCSGFEQHLVELPDTGLQEDIQDGQALMGAGASNPLTGAFAEAFAEREKAVVRTAPSVLLLSGGGQWGAFGAGFLKTLHDRGELPQFDVITGVSTGALQSLFVAIGTADAFKELQIAYTPDRESDIVNRGAQEMAAIKGAIAGLKPLQRRIERKLCAALSKSCLIDQLKASNKKVLIGFVQADNGKFYVADAVKLAKIEDKGKARSCLTGAALASAAMPVFFQQVRVDGKTYYDGGVRLSVFEARAAQALAALAALAEKQAPQDPPPALYVVRNGPTSLKADPKADKAADALTNALRAEAIVVNQLEVGSIAALRLERPTGPISLVTADGWDRQGKCVKPPKIMFDPDFMACLRGFGATRAASGRPWKPLRELGYLEERPRAGGSGR